MGTNCYVVRTDATATEAAVVDPSGDATELRLTLARLGTRCAGDPRHARALGPPARRRGPRRGHRGAGATWRRASASCSRRPPPVTPPGVTLRPYTPDVLLVGGETVDARRDRLRGPGRSRALAGASRVPRRRLPVLRRRPVRGLGRPHRLPRVGLGHASVVDPHARRHAAGGHGRLSRARPDHDARRRAGAEPVPGRAPRGAQPR